MNANQSKWGIVFCPKSGAFRPHKKWEKVEKCLRERGIEYDHVQSENSGSVDRLVKMMISNGYKTLVIVGGDSALNEALRLVGPDGADERLRPFLGHRRG